MGNKAARKFGIVFTLSDRLQTMYTKVINLPAANGDESFEMPIPATYIIDTEGIIVYRFVDADYFKRLEPSEIIRVLKGIKNFDG